MLQVPRYRCAAGPCRLNACPPRRIPMNQALSALLQTVEVDEPVESGGLQVFALRWRPGEPLAYTTLDDGLALGLLEVTEVTDGGSVPTLKVTNKGDAPAFLMAGEQL